MFWETVAPLFANKSRTTNKITLSENETLIINDQKCIDVFNNCFNKELNIYVGQNLLYDASIFDDPIIAAGHKYKRHPSILKIKVKVKKYDHFSFYHVNPDKCLKFSIKENKFTFSKILSKMFNFYIDKYSSLMLMDLRRLILSLFIRKMIFLIKLIIDRPISIFPVLSKALVRCLHDHINEYIDTILSKVQCGFRKGFSTQHLLIAMIEKWRKNMDKGKSCVAQLTFLSKAFDCIVHDFVIAKLEAYGFPYEVKLSAITLRIGNIELK